MEQSPIGISDKISGLPAETIAEIFWKLLEGFDDSTVRFRDRAKWHYGSLARLCLTCRRWRSIVEHAASFWTLLSSTIPKPARTKILQFSGNLLFDVTRGFLSKSPGTKGLMPADMISAFPRWRTAFLRFEKIQHVPLEIDQHSAPQLEKLELHIADPSDETWRGLLGGNTNTLRHLRLNIAEYFFPTSSLASLQELFVEGFFGPSLGPITILEALRTAPKLEKLTLRLQGSDLHNTTAWSAERLQTISLVELPHLEVFHLYLKANVGISLLQHITSASCNHLSVSVFFEAPPRVAELRQALTRFLPCIQRTVKASSRTNLSITLSTINGRSVFMSTDRAASHTFSLRLYFQDQWTPEAFQWLGDLVTPFSQNEPFVTISLTAELATYVPEPFDSPDGWIQSILLMPCIGALDLGGLFTPHSNFLDYLGKPIDVPGGSPRWPLASLKRLATRQELNSPLELLRLLKTRGQHPESGHLAPPAHLAELVLHVGGRGISEKWAEHVPAIEEALKPGHLLVQ
ncbi:hypothetical protein FRC05_003917 [Tulasnella sp. 425]|nr:hypothetical protein FRC05_003917 [Tulasnella sp. 425]